MHVERARHVARRPEPKIGGAADEPGYNTLTTVFTDVYTDSSITTTIQLTPITAVPAPEDATLTQPTSTSSSTTPTTTTTSTSSQTSDSPIAQPTKAPSNAAPVEASKSSKLPGDVVAGIVVTVAILVAILAFYIRKRFIGARNKKTTAWGGKLLPNFKQQGHIEKSAVGYPYAFRHETANAFSPVLPRPVPSYNNPVSSPAAPSVSATLGHTSNQPASSPTAAVCCTFIPTLPDELSISNGEIVRIVNEYDDGWALCANIRGDQGMVPLECLQKGAPGVLLESPVVTDWRNAQRASSLAPPGSRRY